MRWLFNVQFDRVSYQLEVFDVQLAVTGEPHGYPQPDKYLADESPLTSQ
jgi:hypothetical protein